MKFNYFKLILFSALVITLIFTISCSKDLINENTADDTASNSNNAATLKASTVDLPGRTLAANCFQCHGTNGYAGELKIAGQGASGMVQKLTEMKAKDPRDNIMNAHARAYTSDEIKLIADYISKQ